jgi:hypothetical protein
MAEAQLALYWGAGEHIASGERFTELQNLFPQAAIVGCSTGGQIFAGDVCDELVAAIVLRFEKTKIAVIEKTIEDGQPASVAGAAMGSQLMRPDLKCIFVLSDGIHINGSDLVAGISASIGPGVIVTGGLAGDGTRFQETLVGTGGAPRPRRIAAIGFYGSALSIGHGSAGGWDEFGPKRRVSKSERNVLFSLDDEPALDLYERYLGDEAEGLPGTALLYPLLVADPMDPRHAVVRTVLGVNRDERSMTFAGNIPQGWSAQLMRGHFDNLASGAALAARQAASFKRGPNSDAAAIMVSCIGRRILMGQSIADEIAEVEAHIGRDVHTIGFYSYGEIAPHSLSGICELHNQTMTVTTIAEVA